MAIKSVVQCDITGKVIEAKEFQNVTTCSIVYKRMGKVKSFDGKEEIKCITEVENYEFHISSEKAGKFMEGMQKLMNELKES